MKTASSLIQLITLAACFAVYVAAAGEIHLTGMRRGDADDGRPRPGRARWLDLATAMEVGRRGEALPTSPRWGRVGAHRAATSPPTS